MTLIGLLGFATVILLAMFLLHGYLWWRLVRSATRPGRARRGLTALVVLLGLLPALAVGLRRTLPLDAAAPLDWVAYTWLGLAFYAFLALLALEPVRLLARLVEPSGARRAPRRLDELAQPDGGTAPGRGAVREDGDVVARRVPRRDDELAHPDRGTAPGRDVVRKDHRLNRRLFLARTLAVTAGAVAVGTAGTGAYFANSAPVVRRVPITLPRLAPALDGLRIVTFSDAHLSATYGGRRFERLVEIVNEQRPDVVAIVGDLVDGSVEELREDVAPLADLVSEQGVFFVTGNHEYFVDTRAWLRHLPTLGVDVLHNERVPIRRGTASVDLAGIDDRTAANSGIPGQGADLDAALDGRDDATPVVLLAHQPVMVEQARAAGVDLQLSGHTHGGQLWPFDYAIRLDQPSVEGYSRHGDTQLYVTSGAGYWGPPMRVGARPEVTVVELRAPRG
ncbi:metallophosphoesterase [Blastococcus sp. CT_GayMR16]|uniref:metallophosphoesterase n=1 Tax=Blastococcus sp. CT_GayMR16 TaxID=2559607 RepID=UPI001072F001|nr:metallophosphoesterase [Blastococcus sp. CT_GayMR16]TFV85732.1 metallophosphoesterase [Blastococcus sp. CT_GayMR16]